MDPKNKPAPPDAELWAEVQNARNTDIKRLAQLLWGENSIDLEEPEALAMGDVVLNRVGNPAFGASVQDVLNQPKQFSPFNEGDPSYTRVNAFGEGHPYWSKYYALAEKIMEPGRKRSVYDHYFAGEPPWWATSLEGTEKIGRHSFGKEKAGVRKRKK